MVAGRFRNSPFSRSTGEQGDLPEDLIFDVLQNSRRRFAIHFLKQADTPVEIRELVDHIAAWETDKETWEVATHERQRVHVSMLQSHVSALVEAGMVTFDEEANEVGLTERARELDIYLEIVPEGDIDWSEYYLGIALFNAVILGLAWLDVYPFGAIPEGAWIVFVPGVFLLASALHYWYQQKHQLGSGPPPTRH